MQSLNGKDENKGSKWMLYESELLKPTIDVSQNELQLLKCGDLVEKKREIEIKPKARSEKRKEEGRKELQNIVALS